MRERIREVRRTVRIILNLIRGQEWYHGMTCGEVMRCFYPAEEVEKQFLGYVEPVIEEILSKGAIKALLPKFIGKEL